MRDYNRIDRITEKLNKLWKRYPDWRLCQLIFNIANNTDTMYSRDVFHVEDDIMEIVMNRLLEVSKQ